MPKRTKRNNEPWQKDTGTNVKELPNGGKRTIKHKEFLKKIPMKHGRNEGNRKSSLEQHSNNCCRQDPPMNAKISGQNFKEKQDICISSNYLLQYIYYCGSFTLCP